MLCVYVKIAKYFDQIFKNINISKGHNSSVSGSYFLRLKKQKFFKDEKD